MPKDFALVSEQRFGAGEATDPSLDRTRRPAASPMTPGPSRSEGSPIAGASVPSDRGAGASSVRAPLSDAPIRMLRFDAFRLDTVNECLWRDGARIELTPKAFAVLRYLVERGGRLVMQQELLDALWPGTYVQPEILKTYIRDIRKILGDDPRAPRFIETRARRGYRFIAAVSDETSLPVAVPRVFSPRTPAGQEVDLGLLSDVLLPALRDARQDLRVLETGGADRTALVEALQRQAVTQALMWMAVSQSLPERLGHVPDEPGPAQRLALDKRERERRSVSEAEGRRHEAHSLTGPSPLGRSDRRNGHDAGQPRSRRVELVWRGGRPVGEGRPLG